MPDLRTLPLERFLSFIYWYATHNAESEADLAKFDLALWRPPVGEVGLGPWSAEAETDAFKALQAGLSK